MAGTGERLGRRRSVVRALGLRPGEGPAALLLVAMSVAIGLFVAFAFSFAGASFLSHHDTRFLPFAYVASGFVGYLAVRLFGRLERRLGLTGLAVGTLVAALVLLVGFRVAYVVADERWASALLFVVIDPLLTLVDLCFWGVAGRLFDLEQGKRLFGLVSSGEVMVEIAGFFAVPLLLPALGAPADLLIGSAAGLGLAVLVLAVAARRFRARLAPVATATAGPAPGPTPAERPRRHFSRYAFLIATLATASVVATYFVDFAFLHVASQRFPGEEELASYLAVFWGTAELLELVAKALLSGRLLSRFGLGAGLGTLPVAVLACAGLAASGVAMAGSAALGVFVAVSVCKIAEFVVRRSLFDPSFRVLFQPLQPAVRFAVQARLEGAVKQVSLIAAGVALALLGSTEPLALGAVLWTLAGVALIWLAASVVTVRRYRARLLRALSEHVTEAPVAPEAALAREVASLPGPALVHARAALAAVDTELAGRLGLAPPPAIGGPAAAFGAPSAALATPAAALAATAEHWPRLVERLRSPQLCRAAAEALAAIGEPALPLLEAELRRTDDARLKVRILAVYERIGGGRATRFLADRLGTHEREVEGRALAALAALGHRATAAEVPWVKRRLELTAARAAWTTSALSDVSELGQEPRIAPLAAALGFAIADDTASGFALLSMIADPRAVTLLRDHAADPSPAARAYLLEIAELTVPEDLKPALVPLVEPLSPAERRDRLDRVVPLRRLEPVVRLGDVLRQGRERVGPWTRASALWAVAGLGGSELQAEVVACLFHADAMVREVAALALARIAPAACGAALGKLAPVEAAPLQTLLEAGEDRRRTIYEKALALGALPAFRSLLPPAVGRLARAAVEARLAPGEPFRLAEGLLLVTAGRLVEAEAGAVLGGLAADTPPRAVTAVEPTRLLRLPLGAVWDLLADHLEVVPALARQLAAMPPPPTAGRTTATLDRLATGEFAAPAFGGAFYP